MNKIRSLTHSGDIIGTYDPIPKRPTDGEGKPFKDIRLDSVRAKYWLGVGAQPSDPAWRLLSMVSFQQNPHAQVMFLVNLILQIGLLEPKYRPATETKSEFKPKTLAGGS